jgi:hypothetical protein
MPTQIRRDPFARTTLVREIVRCNPHCTCHWCGTVAGFRERLFRYGTEPDSVNPRINWHRGEFCSLSCHNAYHGV